MDERIAALLADETVRQELRRAWEESEPGVIGGHEEGGFICVAVNGDYVIDRWTRVLKSEIQIPPHPGGKRNNEAIVATFHTHPNTGRGYYQAPGTQDRAIVRNDPNLRHSEYVGEFVVSQQKIYFILPSGSVLVLGQTEQLLTGEDK
jgi:hypothetical protein